MDMEAVSLRCYDCAHINDSMIGKYCENRSHKFPKCGNIDFIVGYCDKHLNEVTVYFEGNEYKMKWCGNCVKRAIEY